MQYAAYILSCSISIINGNAVFLLHLVGSFVLALGLSSCGEWTYLHFPGGSVVKNPPARAGASGDAGLIPESGRSPEKEKATHSSILAWRIPRTEEPAELGGLQSMAWQRVGRE